VAQCESFHSDHSLQITYTFDDLLHATKLRNKCARSERVACPLWGGGRTRLSEYDGGVCRHARVAAKIGCAYFAEGILKRPWLGRR